MRSGGSTTLTKALVKASCSLSVLRSDFVGGVQLSVRRKQGVIIAGAVLKNPEILLPDEETSAPDEQLGRIARRALDRPVRNRKTVMVAHRQSKDRPIENPNNYWVRV